jgi:hypothetical protein
MLALSAAAAMASFWFVFVGVPHRSETSARPNDTARTRVEAPAADMTTTTQTADASIDESMLLDPEQDYSGLSQAATPPQISHRGAKRRLRSPAHRVPADLALGRARRPVHRHSGIAGPPDISHADGRGQSSAGDTGDYVLTPVSAESDTDSPGEYVMGSVVLSGRTTDTEVARGW